jgi:hypothetical protein
MDAFTAVSLAITRETAGCVPLGQPLTRQKTEALGPGLCHLLPDLPVVT